MTNAAALNTAATERAAASARAQPDGFIGFVLRDGRCLGVAGTGDIHTAYHVALRWLEREYAGLPPHQPCEGEPYAFLASINPNAPVAGTA